MNQGLRNHASLSTVTVLNVFSASERIQADYIVASFCGSCLATFAHTLDYFCYIFIALLIIITLCQYMCIGPSFEDQ